MKNIILWLLLLAMPAQAEQVRVSIIIPGGNSPLEYSLSEADSKSFWQRWQKLEPTTQMVPLANGSSYAGLRIRAADKDVRLYNGVGTYQIESRSDNLRMLERWVLSKAPPPFGPSLLAALDRDVESLAASQKTANPKPIDINTLLLRCNSRGSKNQELRARCLEEALHERLTWREYANSLEKILRAQER
jgi:hypothetical protein